MLARRHDGGHGQLRLHAGPARADQRELVVRNLERAEDISAEAMAEGIEWTWETYPEYLDAVDRLPKGINYAGYVGHSALRTWAMGERAFEEEATEDDLAVMDRELTDALRAGAVGFTTSQDVQPPDLRRPAGRQPAGQLGRGRRLVGVMGDLGAGMFEIAGEDVGRNPERQADVLGRLRDLAVETGVPITFGVALGPQAPATSTCVMLDLLDSAAARAAA